jgi:acetyl-CoA/propionyl-CoA carboxylase biotin carboxyl carrier protein
VITRYIPPAGPGVRVDSGYTTGDEIPGAYDSLIAKVVTVGRDRDQARRRMLRALDEMVIDGVQTTIPGHRVLLNDPAFVEGTHTTGTVADAALGSLASDEEEARDDVLMFEGRGVKLWNPAMSASASAAVHGSAGSGELAAPMQGTILKVFVQEGQTVEAGEPLVVLEAMKMETIISAPHAGKIVAVSAREGDTAPAGQILVVVE